jgi:hypothetical protein
MRRKSRGSGLRIFGSVFVNQEVSAGALIARRQWHSHYVPSVVESVVERWVKESWATHKAIHSNLENHKARSSDWLGRLLPFFNAVSWWSNSSSKSRVPTRTCMTVEQASSPGSCSGSTAQGPPIFSPRRVMSS